MQTDLYALTNFYQRYDTSLLNAFYKLFEADDKIIINKVVVDSFTGHIKELYFKVNFQNIYGNKELYVILTTEDSDFSLTIRFAQGFDDAQPADRQPGGTWSNSAEYKWNIKTNFFATSSQYFIPNKGFYEPIQYEISDSMSALFFNSYLIGRLTTNTSFASTYTSVFNNSIIMTAFQPAGTNEIGILILANWTQYNSINRKALVLFNGEWYSETLYDDDIFYKRTVVPYNLLSEYSTSSASLAASPLVLKGSYFDTTDGSTKTFHMGHTDLHFTIFHNEKASLVGGGYSNMLPQRARNFIYYYGPKKYHIASTWFKKIDNSINDYSVKVTEPSIHQVEYQYI